MFRWHKEMDRLAIPARRVLRLQRSLNRIQVALPGSPSQEATAYLCAFSAGQGVRVAAVLELHVSRKLAIYLNDQGEVADRRAGAVFAEGVGFAESMGFMLDDLNYQKLMPEERETMWNALPLAGQELTPPAAAAAARSAPLPAVEEKSETDLLDLEGILEEDWLPPSLRRRKRPSPEELERRRNNLRENLGRFLASF